MFINLLLIYFSQKVSSKLEKLEVIKMKHLSKLVKKSRQELHELWDKCYFTTSQRNSFEPLLSDTFSEHILDEHEHKIEQLKSYLEKNSEIFNKVRIKSFSSRI